MFYFASCMNIIFNSQNKILTRHFLSHIIICVCVCVQELEQIEMVWMMSSEWDDHWNTWKSGRFIDVETGDMEDISTTLFKKLQKMSRELKVS